MHEFLTRIICNQGGADDEIPAFKALQAFAKNKKDTQASR
jgi:hypothetical protein